MAAKNRSSRRSNRESLTGNELLALELREIHSAESQLARVLPRLSKAAQSEALREMLDQRLEEGERILRDVDSAFDELEESPGRKRNVAAKGLINDAREHMQQIEAGPARDAVLIAGIQKTEHYCIAAWGTARSLAQALEQRSAVKAMERALKEGKSMDEELTRLAEEEITPALLSMGSEEGDEQQEGATAGRRGYGRRRGRRDSGPGRRAQA
jgi:ferritin-like metal-binding protein YciE